MNKKLFSWKALAGLALLVAMGLTSCKQGTEIDPNDPTGSTKPAKPGVVTGSADLTIKMTVPSDFTTQYNAWWKGLTDDQKKAVKAKDEVTIELQTAAMKLDGSTITLQNTLIDGKADKIVNLVLNSAFAEAKKPLNIDLTAMAKDKVKISLPTNSTAFDLNITAGTAVAELYSAGETAINYLKYDGPTGASALALNSGINVAALTADCKQVAKKGGSVDAVVKNADFNTEKNSDGGGIKGQGVTVYNVIVSADAQVDTKAWDKPLEKISILGTEDTPVTLTIGANTGHAWNPFVFVNTIVGSGAKKSVVKVTASPWGTGGSQFFNVGSVSKVKVTGPAVVSSDIFSEVTFANQVDLMTTSISNVTFGNNVVVNADAATKTFTFDKVTFSGNIIVNLPATVPVIGADGEQATKTTYGQWSADGITATMSGLSEEDILKINKDADPEGGVITSKMNNDQKNAVKNAHKWWVYVDYITAGVKPDKTNIILDFADNCKVGSKALTTANIVPILSALQSDNATATKFKVRIGGALLEPYDADGDGAYDVLVVAE